MLLLKELYKVEEEHTELMVESLLTSPPTVMLNSTQLRKQKELRKELMIRKVLDLQRNKQPDRDLLLESEALAEIEIKRYYTTQLPNKSQFINN